MRARPDWGVRDPAYRYWRRIAQKIRVAIPHAHAAVRRSLALRPPAGASRGSPSTRAAGPRGASPARRVQRLEAPPLLDVGRVDQQAGEGLLEHGPHGLPLHPRCSMATGVTSWLSSHSRRAASSAAIVPKVRTCDCRVPFGSGNRITHAATLFLCTSSPQPRSIRVSMPHLLGSWPHRPPGGASWSRACSACSKATMAGGRKLPRQIQDGLTGTNRARR